MTAKTAKKQAPTRGRDGWYTLPDGTRCLSVTNVIKHGVPKDLMGWAAWMVASEAVESVPRLARLRGEAARKQMVQWLKGAPDRKRDTAAELGTSVHDAVEAIILGQPAPEPTAEQAPFMAAFAQFVADHRPVFEATEITLAHPGHGWAGRGDVWLTLPEIGPALLAGDWKTGSGAYPEAALQLSAYRRAEVGWLRDGTEVEPPKTEGAVVVHIRPDKYPDVGYAVYPVQTGDDVYAVFRAAQQIAAWTMRDGAGALGKAVAAPLTVDEVA